MSGRSGQARASIVFVIKQGSGPMAAAQRIAGRHASVKPAYPDRHPRENLPQTILLRTYLVTVAAGHEQEMLKRALADPQIEQAYVDFVPDA